jgi:hypothetical protein
MNEEGKEWTEEEKKMTLLNYSIQSMKYFQRLDEKYFEGRSESAIEYDHMINLYNYFDELNSLSFCSLCRSYKDEIVERYIIPEEMVEDFKKDENLLKFKFICTECNEKLRKKEKLFYHEIWKPFYTNGTTQFQDVSPWLFYFLCSISWFNLSLKTFWQMTFDEKTAKKYHQLRNYLLSDGDDEYSFNLPEINLVVSSTKSTNEDGEPVFPYLSALNLDICYNFTEKIDFLHTQLKHFHCCCLIHDNGHSWDYSYRIQSNDSLLEIPEEEERQWPRPLYSFISDLHEKEEE